MTDSLEPKGKDLVLTWLFNPFHFVAGGKALAIGLAGIVAASLVGSVSNSHFDGVLDFHTGAPAPLWLFLLEGIVDWLAMAVPLLVAGLLLSKSRVRIVDVLGTQALARFPMILTAEAGLLSFYPGFSRQVIRLMHGNLEVVPLDLAVFAFFGLITIVVIVWTIALMYRAFAVACNLHGAKAAVPFVLAILVAETCSKVAIVGLVKLIDG